VRRRSPELMQAVNQWFEENAKTAFYTSLYRKYFYRNKYFDDTITDDMPLISGNSISVYDDLIRQNAATIGWDWRLLAALIHKESQFNPEAESWAGAVGLMQLMPATARRMGIAPADFFVPEQNIKGGVKYLKHLNQFFRAIEDGNERVKFMLAAYNSGEAHIIDARALALKYGKNPNIWTDNVDIYIRLKSNPEYYNDEVCKYGYARGEETFQYVRRVLERFEYYKTKVNF
jgi:membrane-bound lytic murein transglycosylase F